MIALLSPAKKMAFTELPGASAYSQPRFLADTEILIERARKLSRPRIAALMGISETLADLNWRRFREFSLPFTPVNARPAILAFRGDTYVGLDADTLKPADLTFAQDHVRILSGLYGLLRPLDLIQPYRLEMGARLGNVRGRDLYKFWGDRVTDAIVQDSGGAAIVNLASEEYFKAVRPERLQGRLVTPVFHEIKDGNARVIGFSAKRSRGMMARFIIDGRLTDPEGMKEFAEAGYRYQPKESDESRWIFSRRAP